MTVLGCGGAATAICIQAALDGVREISIFNANDAFFHRAEENAEKINANTGCVAHAYPLEDKARLRAEIADSALLANATSVGMGKLEGISLIDDASMLRPKLICTDVIYSPEETAFLKLARQAGCPHHERAGHGALPGGRVLPAVDGHGDAHRRGEGGALRASAGEQTPQNSWKPTGRPPGVQLPGRFSCPAPAPRRGFSTCSSFLGAETGALRHCPGAGALV